MRSHRNLLILACIAILAISLAVFSLREDPLPPYPAAASTPAAADPHPSLVITNHPPETGDRPASPPDFTADYFPLSADFRLNYLVEVSSKREPTRLGIATIAVEGQETVRGHEYWKVFLRVTGITEMREPVLRYTRKTADAWLEVEAQHKGNPAFEAVALPLPPRPGLRWDKETPAERSQWKVEGTETAELLGKTYPHCLRISYERHLPEEPDYFETGHCLLAPDVGLVQQVAMASGTRISFTRDPRPAEAIAFYTGWAGTYQGFSDGGPTGSRMQLSTNGRYKLARSSSDTTGESGHYEPNPAREGEMILRSDSGQTSAFSFRRIESEPRRATLHLKRVSGANPSGEVFLRDAPSQ